jgi:hypothetical protein
MRLTQLGFQLVIQAFHSLASSLSAERSVFTKSPTALRRGAASLLASGMQRKHTVNHWVRAPNPLHTMTKKKEIILTTAGLVSACLLSICYAAYFLLYLFGASGAHEKSVLIDSLIPLLTLTTLISIRHILVSVSNINY